MYSLLSLHPFLNMNVGNKKSKDKTMKIEIEDYILYDKLNMLTVEYANTIKALVNISIAILIDDIEFTRNLHMDKTKFSRHQSKSISCLYWSIIFSSVAPIEYNKLRFMYVGMRK